MIRLRLCMLGLLAAITPAVIAGHPNYDYREGDILFYSGNGAQSEAIRDATDSSFTHCGVLFQHEGKWWVFEAIQPIKSTPLEQFLKRAKPETYRAFRLKQPLAADAGEKVREWVKQQAGKDYDIKFLWEDEKLYCSELIWKLYAQAGVQLCRTRAFKEYNLHAPTVKRIIEQRYGSLENLPMDEPVVAPSDIANSDLLVEAPRINKVGKH